MKKIIFLALLLTYVLTIKGQQQLSYTYDAAGNRISRTIVVSSSIDSVQQKILFREWLADKELEISHDQDRLGLLISVLGEESPIEGNYSLGNADGIILAQYTINYEENRIDMDNLNKGEYFLDITLSGEKSRWQILLE